MKSSMTARSGNPARVFGQGILDEPAPAPAWERELRAEMSRMGYTSVAVSDAVEWARGSLTLDGCESVDPSDVPLLDEVLADARTDATAPTDGFDATVFEPGGYQPTDFDRAWAAQTAAAHFQGSVTRSLIEDMYNDAIATEAHERGLTPPDPRPARPVYLKPVRRRSRPISDADRRRSGAL